MEVTFVGKELRHLDGLRTEALAIPIFEEERPLRGVAGLADWRLAGQLSDALGRGEIRATRGHRVLVPGRPKLPFERVFLFGAGSREVFDEAVFKELVLEILATLAKVRTRAAATVLPGRHASLIEPERAMSLFLALVLGRQEQDEFVIIDSVEAARQMEGVVDREWARYRARMAAPQG